MKLPGPGQRTHPSAGGVCVCVCACVRVRVPDRGRGTSTFGHSHQPASRIPPSRPTSILGCGRGIVPVLPLPSPTSFLAGTITVIIAAVAAAVAVLPVVLHWVGPKVKG